jgi:hypothetical protein
MQILHILKRDPDETTMKIIETNKKDGHVSVIDLRCEKDYDNLVRLVESSDRVICW